MTFNAIDRRCSFCAMRGKDRVAVATIQRRGKTWALCSGHYQEATTTTIAFSDAEIDAIKWAIRRT